MARDDSVLYTGDTTGRVSRIDLRTLRLSGTYKGNTGSVRDIAIHPTLPRLATVGLDRIMRVFDSESRQQLHRVYLRQQLNAVLFTSEEEVKMFAEEESEEEKPAPKKRVAKEEKPKTIAKMEEPAMEEDSESEEDNYIPLAERLKMKMNNEEKSTIVDDLINTKSTVPASRKRKTAGAKSEGAAKKRKVKDDSSDDSLFGF